MANPFIPSLQGWRYQDPDPVTRALNLGLIPLGKSQLSPKSLGFSVPTTDAIQSQMLPFLGSPPQQNIPAEDMALRGWRTGIGPTPATSMTGYPNPESDRPLPPWIGPVAQPQQQPVSTQPSAFAAPNLGLRETAALGGLQSLFGGMLRQGLGERGGMAAGIAEAGQAVNPLNIRQMEQAQAYRDLQAQALEASARNEQAKALARLGGLAEAQQQQEAVGELATRISQCEKITDPQQIALLVQAGRTKEALEAAMPQGQQTAKAPDVVSFFENGNVAQRQWNPESRTWETLGYGPRWQPQGQGGTRESIEEAVARARAIAEAQRESIPQAVARIEATESARARARPQQERAITPYQVTGDILAKMASGQTLTPAEQQALNLGMRVNPLTTLLQNTIEGSVTESGIPEIPTTGTPSAQAQQAPATVGMSPLQRLRSRLGYNPGAVEMEMPRTVEMDMPPPAPPRTPSATPAPANRFSKMTADDIANIDVGSLTEEERTQLSKRMDELGM